MNINKDTLQTGGRVVNTKLELPILLQLDIHQVLYNSSTSCCCKHAHSPSTTITQTYMYLCTLCTFNKATVAHLFWRLPLALPVSDSWAVP